MAEDLHKDNLESFFKETFDDQSDQPSKDGWDIPSDRVWNSVNDAINPSDDDTVGFVWFKYLWLGAMALIFTVCGIIFFTSDRIENQPTLEATEQKALNENQDKPATSEKVLENEIKSADAPETEISSDETSKQSAVTSKETSDIDEIASSNNNSTDKLSTQNNSTENSSPGSENLQSSGKEDANSPIEKTTKQNPNTTPPVQDKRPDNSNSSNNQNDQENKSTKKKDIATTEANRSDLATDQQDNENAISQAGNAESDSSSNLPAIKTIDLLDPIPTKELLVQLPNTEPDTLALIEPFVDLNQNTNKAAPKINGFYVGLSLAPTNTYREIKIIGNPVIPRDLDMFEKAGFSYSAGLTLGYKISEKWSVETGFTYSKLSIQHNRRKQVQYTSIGEQDNGQGEFQREYGFSLNTSGGAVDTDIALARSSGTTIQENEFIALNIKADQNISFGTIPVIVRYGIGKGKFKLGLKAGLVNRIALDGYFQVTDVQTVRNGVRPVLNDQVFRKRPMKNLKKYQVDYLFGIGINYHLSDKIWLQLEPTFSKSISPIFENQNYKTFPVYKSVDFRVNYLF